MSEIDMDESGGQANEDGTLSVEWTLGDVRKEVERRMSLEAETLAPKEYKRVVKEAINSTQQELDRENEEAAAKSKPAKKGKTTKTTQPTKERSKPEGTSSSTKKPTEKRPPTKRSRKSQTPKRSASVVPSSDDEMRGEEATTSSAKSAPEAAPKTKTQKTVVSDEEFDAEKSLEPPKKRQKNNTEAEDIEMQDTEAASKAKPEASASPGVRDTKHDNALNSDPADTVADSGYKSTKEPKARKSKQPSKELTKDEETIKRLKSLVVACGVRKQWAKEFKGMDRPSEQIRRLKQILSDLGMAGRMSLEQAKAIREKRELAQELEDVKNFEQSVVSNKRASRLKEKTQTTEEAPEEESDEDVAEMSKRPRGTARQSIMAFLGDQSDDD
ncbi:uncharacterized protein B0H18DRAFT_1004882 [Fomitopsis serialis]|uniref:uncharacterized protein n=1 Tax=Fomitopsis serialis TaxID=139415 RepID=UPI002008842E|nr:uncharacterized protein B0H18DRAFT_1004882 [Neoantrodia serialis]KAH9926994.1 hypothetical protein B0H18DRAFT_1004882 [Neoantrodia serialis]